jgi:ribose transport system ATP-binding protein
VIRSLKERGVGIIYISHRLEEIFEVGDRVTVLRDGTLVHACPISEIDRRGLIRKMVGRELENEYPRAALERGKEILRIEDLCSDRISHVNLTLYRRRGPRPRRTRGSGKVGARKAGLRRGQEEGRADIS